jgi:hypothetical protein
MIECIGHNWRQERELIQRTLRSVWEKKRQARLEKLNGAAH